MLLDKQTVLENSDSAITATRVYTNVIDAQHSGNTLKDLGTGGPLYLYISVTEAFNNLTSLAVTLESDDNASLSSATTHFTKSIALAGLTLGAEIVKIRLPEEATYERYIGGRATVTGTAPTTGKLLVALVGNVPAYKAYNQGSIPA